MAHNSEGFSLDELLVYFQIEEEMHNKDNKVKVR